MQNNNLQFLECPLEAAGHVQDLWDVTYSPEWICAPKGSTVEISCTFTYPEGINKEVNTLQETFWSTERHKYEVDVKEDSKYSGRVQNTCVGNNCTLRITDVRQTDMTVYKFILKTNISSDLQMKVSRHEAVLIFTCFIRCPGGTSFIWFKNGEEIKDETSSLISLIPVHTSLTFSLRSCCILFSSSLFPDLKVCFFLLRRAFRSLVIQGLLLGKQRTVRAGKAVFSQNLMYSVMQSVMLLMSSPCGSQSTSQSVDSKQSCSASLLSCVHLLTVLVVTGCLWTRGIYSGVSRTRLWSDLPRGGKGSGTVCFLNISIQKVQCFIFSSWTVNILMKSG
uniref:Ig-like domain-containing protein n=1 Tax=Labrus bergylta TaxID=56723 RepID=A0A3Q3F2G8_9LABR